MTDDRKILVIGGDSADSIRRALEQAKGEPCTIMVGEPYEITLPLNLIIALGNELTRQSKEENKREKQPLPKPPRSIGVARKNLFAHQRRFGR